jgi:hypothetical protein
MDQAGTVLLVAAVWPSRAAAMWRRRRCPRRMSRPIRCSGRAVPALRLDEVLPDPARRSLIRLDIEGSEPLALRGAEGVIRCSPDLQIGNGNGRSA